MLADLQIQMTTGFFRVVVYGSNISATEVDKQAHKRNFR